MRSRLCPRRSGAAILELALILPLFLTVLLGAIHFGYLFYLYNGLEKSVRDGARYAASRTFTNRTEFESVVEKVVVTGVQSGSTPIVTGLLLRSNPNGPSRMVRVTPIPDTVGVRPEKIRVEIRNYTYTGVLSPLLGEIQLNGKPSLEVPFFGRYDPT